MGRAAFWASGAPHRDQQTGPTQRGGRSVAAIALCYFWPALRGAAAALGRSADHRWGRHVGDGLYGGGDSGAVARDVAWQALRVGRVFPKLRLPLPERALLWSGVLIVSWSLLRCAADARAGSPFAACCCRRWPRLIWAMRWCFAQSSSGSRAIGLAVLGLTVLSSLVALMSGSLAPMVQPLLTLYLLGWLLIRRRLRVWPVVLRTLAVLLFQPVKGEFRAQVWDREVRLSLFEQTKLFVDLSARHWLGGEDRQDRRPRAIRQSGGRRAPASALQLSHIVRMARRRFISERRDLSVLPHACTFAGCFSPTSPAQILMCGRVVMYGCCRHRSGTITLNGLQLPVSQTSASLAGLGSLLFLRCIADEMLAHRDICSG